MLKTSFFPRLPQLRKLLNSKKLKNVAYVREENKPQISYESKGTGNRKYYMPGSIREDKVFWDK